MLPFPVKYHKIRFHDTEVFIIFVASKKKKKMAQGSRQIQTQAQQQVQTLSPQQILVVKLLELPTVELEDRIRAELLENPALEEGKEETATDDYSNDAEGESNSENSETEEYDSLGDYLTEDDIPDYKLQENNRSRGEQPEEIPFSDAISSIILSSDGISSTNRFSLSSTVLPDSISKSFFEFSKSKVSNSIGVYP